MSVLLAISRKLLALAILAFGAALAYLTLVEPVLSRVTSALDRIETATSLLARLDRPASTDDRPTADRAASEAATRAMFLEGESDAVMVARLQSLLRAAAASAEGVRIASVRPFAPRDQDGLRMIGLEARCIASLAGLQRLLLALEASKPVVLVGGMQILPTSQRLSLPVRNGSDAALGDDTRDASASDTFEVRLEIAGAAAPRATVTTRAPPGTPLPSSADVAEPKPLESARGKAL